MNEWPGGFLIFCHRRVRFNCPVLRDSFFCG